MHHIVLDRLIHCRSGMRHVQFLGICLAEIGQTSGHTSSAFEHVSPNYIGQFGASLTAVATVRSCEPHAAMYHANLAWLRRTSGRRRPDASSEDGSYPGRLCCVQYKRQCSGPAMSAERCEARGSGVLPLNIARVGAVLVQLRADSGHSRRQSLAHSCVPRAPFRDPRRTSGSS